MDFIKLLVTSIILLSATGSTYAALYNRGNGMIYDSEQNITWLQDMSYFQTAGLTKQTDGGVASFEASYLARNLIYNGISGWRLPSSQSLYASSEFVHLYGELGNQIGGGLANTGPFVNFRIGVYFDGAEGLLCQYCTEVTYKFNTASGERYSTPVDYPYALGVHYETFMTAVHAGDVSAVPVPATAWLFGSSMLGLAGFMRNKFKLV